MANAKCHKIDGFIMRLAENRGGSIGRADPVFCRTGYFWELGCSSFKRLSEMGCGIQMSTLAKYNTIPVDICWISWDRDGNPCGVKRKDRIGWPLASLPRPRIREAGEEEARLEGLPFHTENNISRTISVANCYQCACGRGPFIHS